MQSTVPSGEGTTLYISELANGLVFTLSIRDVGHGEHEKHIWKTSYPLLDLLYPHWVAKQPVNTPIDFFAQSLQKAEQAFGWKLLTDSGRIKIPEESFGDGVTRSVALRESMGNGLLAKLVSDKFVTVTKRETMSIGKELLNHIDSFNDPVVVIIINFFSVEVVEFLPKTVGRNRRWEYKSSKIQFESAQEFVDYLATKKFIPFISEHVPESQLFNTLLNYTYWRPLTTSSQLVKDLWRALMTSLLAELTQYTSIQSESKGHLFVSGEIPLFMNDNARVQLALVDGLGLSGQWTVTIDEHSQLLPFIADTANIDPFKEISIDKCSLWTIPQTKKSKNIAKVSIGSAEYQGVYGNLYTYGNHSIETIVSCQVDADKSEFRLPEWMSVGTVTIDLRPWPVVYGPNTVANSVKIPQWLDRIRKKITIK